MTTEIPYLAECLKAGLLHPSISCHYVVVESLNIVPQREKEPQITWYMHFKPTWPKGPLFKKYESEVQETPCKYPFFPLYPWCLNTVTNSESWASVCMCVWWGEGDLNQVYPVILIREYEWRELQSNSYLSSWKSPIRFKPWQSHVTICTKSLLKSGMISDMAISSEETGLK